MKIFTLNELSYYDGKQGRPAYIAYKVKVYDVTDSFLWKGGRHQALHEAGKMRLPRKRPFQGNNVKI